MIGCPMADSSNIVIPEQAGIQSSRQRNASRSVGNRTMTVGANNIRPIFNGAARGGRGRKIFRPYKHIESMCVRPIPPEGWGTPASGDGPGTLRNWIGCPMTYRIGDNPTLKGGPPRHQQLLPVAHLSRWDDGIDPSRTAAHPADSSNIVIPEQAGIQSSRQRNASRSVGNRTMTVGANNIRPIFNGAARGGRGRKIFRPYERIECGCDYDHEAITPTRRTRQRGELGRVGREHYTDRCPKRPGGEVLTPPGHTKTKE